MLILKFTQQSINYVFDPKLHIIHNLKKILQLICDDIWSIIIVCKIHSINWKKY